MAILALSGSMLAIPASLPSAEAWNNLSDISVTTFGGSGSVSTGESVAIDGAGNSYTAGTFLGTVDFDSGIGNQSVTSLGGYDIYITKLNSRGENIWAKRIGGINYDAVSGLLLDSSGNIYMLGNFSGSVDFDPGAGTSIQSGGGTQSTYILKMSSEGLFIWVNTFDGESSGSVYGKSMVLDPSGNLTIVGSLTGGADFDPGAGITRLVSAGISDIYITQLNSLGELLWTQRVGGPQLDSPMHIKADSSGNFRIVGYFSETVDFNAGVSTVNLVSAGSYDIFDLKLNSLGQYMQAYRFGGGGVDMPSGAVFDSNDNFFLVATISQTVDFDPSAAVADLLGEVVIVKYNSLGVYVWGKQMSGVQPNQITVDSSGNLYITGTIGANLTDLDPGAGTANFTGAGSYDIFFLKLNSLGEYLWAKTLGTYEYDSLNSFEIDANGYLYLVGAFGGNMDFDPGPRVATVNLNGTRNAFFMTLTPSGNLLPDVNPPSLITSVNTNKNENIANTINAATVTLSESASVSMVSGGDGALFNLIVSNTITSVLRFKNAPDFESPQDIGGNNLYEITINATDSYGNSGDVTVTITILDLVDSLKFIPLTLAGATNSAVYRTAIVISANVNVAAKITFMANGFRIPGCINRLTAGVAPNIIATCSWKSSHRGSTSLTATGVPTGVGISNGQSSPFYVNVRPRTTRR